MMATD